MEAGGKTRLWLINWKRLLITMSLLKPLPTDMDGKFENDQADETGGRLSDLACLFRREIASQGQKQGKKKSR